MPAARVEGSIKGANYLWVENQNKQFRFNLNSTHYQKISFMSISLAAAEENKQKLIATAIICNFKMS